MSALRSCMSATTCSSVKPWCAISLVASGSGITPIALPPLAEDRVGHDPHQADATAAVHQADTVVRERPSHRVFATAAYSG